MTKGRIETAKLRVESLIQDDIQVCSPLLLTLVLTEYITQGRATRADRGMYRDLTLLLASFLIFQLQLYTETLIARFALLEQS